MADSRVELVRLEDEFVLYDRNSGAIAIINRTAADVWSLLNKRVCKADLISTLALQWKISEPAASSYAHSLIGQWKEAGFIDPPGDDLAPQFEDRAPSIFNWQKAYYSGRARVSLRVENPAFGEILNRVLHSLPRLETPSACGSSGVRRSTRSANEACVDVVGWHGGYTVFFNGVFVWGPADFATARHMVLREILRAGAPNSISAVLHASSAALDGSAVIFAGQSGAGKSTLLSSLLLRSEWKYVADDLAGLDRGGQLIWPFPVAISLKPNANNPIRDKLSRRSVSGSDNDRELILTPPDEFGLKYIDASRKGSGSKPMPIRLACFPFFDSSCERPSFERVSPSMALKALIDSGTRVVGRNRSIEPLVNMLRATPAYSLRYSDCDDAIHFISGRLANVA